MMHFLTDKYKTKERGYVLLLCMLLVGLLGVYLSYAFALKKENIQSWQLAKTSTEFSYWFDIEKNYEMDYSITDPSTLNNIQLTDLMQNKHYLPFGVARTPTFPTTTINQVSEFVCSPLPGLTTQDINTTLSLKGTSNTCPSTAGAIAHCDLNAADTPYYACANNSATSQAQYYINANYIALGNDASNTAVGLGLIVRTPGFAQDIVSLPNGQSRGLLPADSTAQSLISRLPTASFNVYGTQSPQVNGIGIGSYVMQLGSDRLLTNNRYSKIIDMGLVQAVDLFDASTVYCYGWNGDTKIGMAESYIGSPPTSTTGGPFPPSCIQINIKKYTSQCNRVDVLYTPYRNYIAPTGNVSTVASHFYSAISAKVKLNGDYRDVFLGQNQQVGVTSAGASSSTYNGNGAKGTNQYTWFIYLVRCTRPNPNVA